MCKWMMSQVVQWLLLQMATKVYFGSKSVKATPFYIGANISPEQTETSEDIRWFRLCCFRHSRVL